MSIEDSEEFLQVLTRLNAKVSDMESIGVSTSTNKFTSADLSGCLVGIDEIGLTGLKWRINQTREYDEGFMRLYARIIDLANNKKWKGKTKAIDKGTVRRFLRTCLDDYYTALKCKRCKGTGRTQIEKDGVVTRTCQSCNGKRFRKRNNTERAGDMLIDRREYSRTWKDRHPVIMDMLINTMPNCMANAREQLRKNIREGRVRQSESLTIKYPKR